VKIGLYEVLGELGRGGMGVVYRVRAPAGGDAALKLLAKVTPDALVRFERERRLLASLGEAEGFVGLLDAGSSRDSAWLVMPLVPGGTLRQSLERGPLGVEETIALGIELATALGRAHERGIVHRDLKPENILFTTSGRPLLADLGLAKHFDLLAKGASQSIKLTKRGVLKGTAGYMAPEQLADAAGAGPAADVFALGALLYECLAGRPAFEGETIIEVLTKVSAGTIERLDRPGVPRWLEAVLARSLATDPSARFEHGANLAGALRARSPRPDGVPGRKAGARRVTSVLAAAAACALVAIGVAVALLARAPRAGTSGPSPPNSPRTAPAPAAGAPALAPGAEPSDTAASIAPTASALLMSALEKAQRQQLDEALADVIRALELDPGNAATWGTRGEIRENMGDLQAAIADYNEAIARDEKLVSAWRLRGGARGTLGDVAGAEHDLTRTIELDGKNAVDFLNRALARAKLEDTEGALADVNRALELDPSVVRAWSLRGALRADRGDRESAIADLDHALELAPRDLEALLHRALVHAERGDAERSRRDLDAATAIDPSDERLATVRHAIEALEKR
jgi:serine/threonine protein kinase